MRKYFLMVFVLLSGWTLTSMGQTGPITPALLRELDKAEAAMFQVTYDGDSAAFRKLCGKDYYTINANGEGHTLEESIPFVPRFKGATTTLSEQRQRVFGNLALRTGRASIFYGGKQVAEVLYTTGWLYSDNRWQYIHWQGTMTGMMLEQLRGKVNLEPPPAK